MRYADRRSGMAALIAEQFGDEIGRAIHRLGQGVEGRFDIEEPAEPHDLLHPVELAERRMRVSSTLMMHSLAASRAASTSELVESLPWWRSASFPSCPNGSWP